MTGIALANEAGVTVTLPSAPLSSSSASDQQSDQQTVHDSDIQIPIEEESMSEADSVDEQLSIVTEDIGNDTEAPEDDNTGNGIEEPDAPELITANIQDDQLSIHISDAAYAVSMESPLTIVVELPDQVMPSPGVFAHGDIIECLEPTDDGVTQTLRLTLSSCGDLTIDLMGASSVEQIPISLIAGDETIAAIQATAQLANQTTKVALASPRMALKASAVSSTQSFVTNGYYTNASTKHQIPKIASFDTNEVAYCNNINLSAPGDPQHGSSDPVSYTSWSFSSDASTAASQGQNLLDFIMFHGYPVDPTISGLCSNADDAQSATQWAIWYFTNNGISPTQEASRYNWTDGFWAAYRWLISSAQAYNTLCEEQGASNQPEYGTCQVWVAPLSNLQNLLTATPHVGWVDLVKTSSNPSITDGSTWYSLANATYSVLDGSGSTVATLTTDDEGKATAQLAVGTYSIVETGAPAGYELSQDTLTVSVSGGPVHVIAQASDTPILGSLSITKTDGSSEPVALTGAMFELAPQAGGAAVATLITDANGQAGTDNVLPLGSYVLTETVAPSGYLPVEPVAVTISQDTPTVHLDLIDTPDTHDVTLYKVSSLDAAPLAGARFELLSPRDSESTDMGVITASQIEDASLWDTVASAESQTNGAITFANLLAGTYILVERTAPDGYEAIDGGWRLVLQSDGSFSLESIGNAATPLTIDGSTAIPNSMIVELPAAGGSTSQTTALVAGGIIAVIASITISLYIVVHNNKNKLHTEKGL